MKSKLILSVGLLLITLNQCSITIGNSDLNVVPAETDRITSQLPASGVYQGCWDAITHFDFDYINRHEVTKVERDFVCGLQSMIAGDFDEAEKLFWNIFTSSRDSLMRKQCAIVLQALLNYAYKWDKLVELDRQLPGGLDEENSMAFARAFQSVPPERITFPDKPVVLPTDLSISGVPIIEVTVNGRKQKFWIDTGAEMTVLASDVARKCGITEFQQDIAKLGTATEIMVESWPGVIPELKIGELTIEHHPAIVIDKKDLEVRLFKLIKLIKIDGILGWNAIMQLQLEIDYQNGLTTIQKPVTNPSPVPNFHYAGVPFLSLSDTSGTPFYFFLDTGANRTGLYEPALGKVDTLLSSRKTALVGGAGGTQKIEHIQLPQQSFLLGRHRLNFKNIGIHGDCEYYFFHYGGVIGSDIARFGTLVLDFKNGRCELKLSEEKP